MNVASGHDVDAGVAGAGPDRLLGRPDRSVGRRQVDVLAASRGQQRGAPLRTAATPAGRPARGAGGSAGPPGRRGAAGAGAVPRSRPANPVRVPTDPARCRPPPGAGGADAVRRPTPGRGRGTAGGAAASGLRGAVSYTHLRAHETKANLVCRLLLEK